MDGIGLARIEFLAFFLHRLKVTIDPEFVILFRRRRADICRLEKGTWAIWNQEISKVLTEEQLNWKWDITDKE